MESRKYIAQNADFSHYNPGEKKYKTKGYGFENLKDLVSDPKDTPR